jgi:ribonucleoside-diphosphate reductase alpha chain
MKMNKSNSNSNSNTHDMYVIKRNGKKEKISFDKILQRIKCLGKDANLKNIIYAQLAIKVIDQLHDDIKTTKIDELSAEQCAAMSSRHPDYSKLGSAIIISNLQKNTNDCFYETIKKLYEFKDINNKNYRLIHDDIMKLVEENREYLNSIIDYKRDFLFDYFGFKTLERAYLMKCNNVIVERPQHMWLRVSITIHGSDLEKVRETYDLMSQKYFIHATPTLFNAGTPRPQLSSCYLIAMESDSIEGIFNTVKECAQISKWSGGIGLHVHNIRSSGSHIRGTNGVSNGLIPMLGVFNKTARYVDQGGKRNGSFAIYLEPHHPDIEEFLDLKKNHGDEESKCRDLFYGLWLSDLFMERVMGNKEWSLFCPDKCPGLCDCYGEEHRALYLKYETEEKYNKQINARDLWMKILDAQMETGTPYLLYKDAANSKSNQKNLGTIKSSNLCVAPETLILTDNGHEEIQLLDGQSVNVWNGLEFTPTTVHQTSENSELIEVHMSDESVLTCTKYHKFYIYSNDEQNNEQTLVDASMLKEGMNIIPCEYPIIDNIKNILENAYNNSNGTYINYKLYCSPNSELFVPINYSLHSKLTWLAGYCFTINQVYNESHKHNTRYRDYKNKNKHYDMYIYTNKYLKILSTNKKILLKLKLMLQTCGINPAICLYNDPANKDLWSLVISSAQFSHLIRLGFNTTELILSNTYYVDKQTDKQIDNFISVKKVVDNNRTDKTYCFNETKRHAGIFNGIITSQCTEIIEYSDKNETAVCNLASIGLPLYVKDDLTFDYEKLYEVTKVLVLNLNNIIDVNFYPTPKTSRSNFLHRPIGIGVQGLADTFFKMDVAFTSEKAKEINSLIFETIYYAALERSYEISYERNKDLNYLKEEYGYQNWTFKNDNIDCREYNVFNVTCASSDKVTGLNKELEDLLKKHRPIYNELFKLDKDNLGAYSSFKGSPISEGLLQFDLWNAKPYSNRYDWQKLRENIMKHGIRNSLLCAPMPTASTSQILGNNECFEPITSNIYSRRTLAGEFILVNKYLVEDLIKLNLWDEDIKNGIISNNGSVQHIKELTDHIKEKYKTVWEISMKELINMSHDRAIYICQSQSLNLWMEDPDPKALTNMHFYSWKKGLKTGIYYLRRRAKHKAQQFTIEPEKQTITTNEEKEISGDKDCLMCGS